MADENELVTGNETSETPAAEKVTTPKKTRAPRGSKKFGDAAVVSAVAPKTRKPRKKREQPSLDASSAAVASSAATDTAVAAAKSPRQGRIAKAAVKAPVSAAVLDEFAELIRLEEENKQLRKALSEKLRSENAELRRKLGQD